MTRTSCRSDTPTAAPVWGPQAKTAAHGARFPARSGGLQEPGDDQAAQPAGRLLGIEPAVDLPAGCREPDQPGPRPGQTGLVLGDDAGARLVLVGAHEHGADSRN